MFSSKNFIMISLSLFSLIFISLCIEQPSILLLPFKTKSLQKELEEEDWIEPYQTEGEEEDWPYVPTQKTLNSSEFINKWFYNGLYIMTNINKNRIESYLNMENSKLSIEECNIKRIYTPNRDKSYYKPLNSETFTKKEENIGNDVFNFIGDLRYKTNVDIGEKGNGLDFYFNENENDKDLCGNFGFNIDTTLDKTNLISQLKKKNYISEYIWTLKYLLEDDGIIVLGTKPHFYNNGSYYMSQYCEMKAIQNQSPETAWSFKIDEIRIKPKNTNKVILSDLKIDFLPDRGLIIGTDEYKKKIDDLIFNDLISKKICSREETTFKDIEKGTNEIYYVYYCSSSDFMGNKYTIDKTYYNTFPSLEFYIKESNMTFTLNKENLFYKIYKRVYFLIVFKKNGNSHNIWKLGEPFFSHFQFTFDQERKIVGFYNQYLPMIKNDDYMKRIEKNNKILNDSGNKKTIIYIIVISIVLILILGALAYFLGKKLNENRKKRANELNDEDFEYSTSDSINSVENTKEKDML